MSDLEKWIEAALTVADTTGMKDAEIIPTWPSDVAGFYPTLTMGALREWQFARSQGGAVEPVAVCDGKEQEAFERYAESKRMDMTQHPLHYLFLSDRTATARDAWKAAITYCTSAHPPARTQGGVAEGYALAPKSMCISQEDVGLIAMMTGWDDEDQSDAEGVLWFGLVEDDDGKQTYGLNISCSECMEEGAIQLVQFDEPKISPGDGWVPESCELGIYGKAYDGPNKCRAYTHLRYQPDNTVAYKLGDATTEAYNDPMGDHIDRGLCLLKRLEAKGLGVFELERPQPPKDNAQEGSGDD